MNWSFVSSQVDKCTLWSFRAFSGGVLCTRFGSGPNWDSASGPNGIRLRAQLRFGSGPKWDSAPGPNEIRLRAQMRSGSGPKWDLAPGPNEIWLRAQLRFGPGPKWDSALGANECTSIQGARDDHRDLIEYSISAPTLFPVYGLLSFPPILILSTVSEDSLNRIKLMISLFGVFQVLPKQKKAREPFLFLAMKSFFSCLSEFFLHDLFLYHRNCMLLVLV